MVALDTKPDFASIQHLYLEGVSWDFYERVLLEAEERRLHITFDRGEIEIMSPLPDHEWLKKCVARLIELMCLERRISLAGLGNVTLRDELKQRGLEPDECYYVRHAKEAKAIRGRFDPSIHPVPDLAIEADITRRSIPRQPIYASLGVPELWRIKQDGIECLHLTDRETYALANRSLSFPFLSPASLWPWVERLQNEDDVVVLNDFRDWVITLQS